MASEAMSSSNFCKVKYNLRFEIYDLNYSCIHVHILFSLTAILVASDATAKLPQRSN